MIDYKMWSISAIVFSESKIKIPRNAISKRTILVHLELKE
jgi:hypothetical protein